MKSLQYETLDELDGDPIAWRGFFPEEPGIALGMITLGMRVGWAEEFTATSAFLNDEDEGEKVYRTMDDARAAIDHAMNLWIERHTNGWKEARP